MHDSEVVAAIAAGDPDGLAEAYDRYAAPLYTYCRSLLREPADAADAVQDTFVIAASKVAGLRDQSRLRPWLYAVARNECHRRLRDKASATTSALDQMPEMSDESADLSEGAERAELRALLRSAVRGLGASEQDLIQLQLRQELDVAEIAAVLGVSRNHAHALLSRARAQLEVSLGALLVARSGRGDCEALGALLQDWDGQLNVLMRKRINRHIERCPECTERKRRELAPALLLGLAPLPLAVMPPGMRSQVLKLVSSNTPDAVAHRASVAQRADMSGPGGFPKPLDPPKSAWWQARTVQGAAAAAIVVAAAAVLTILALTGAFGTHSGQLSALSHGTSSAGAGTGSSGGTAPGSQPGGTGGSGSSGSPGTSAKAIASAAARVSPSPAAGGATPVGGGSSPSARPSGPSPAPSHSPSPRHSPSPSYSPSPAASGTTAPPPPPPPGTLSVAPRTIVLSALSGVSLRLTASGGPVSWSVTESSGLIGKLSVAPASGRLLAGQSTTVSVNVSGGLLGLADRAVTGSAAGAGVCVGCQLTVNPGGIVVSVIIEIDVTPSSPAPSSSAPSCPPPSSGSPEPETASGCKNARLVN
jgi:RNA polymerase sigma factor (sigma-70 family)